MSRRRPNLTDRVHAFYEANPDEELTFKAVSEKFGCKITTAYGIVYQLVDMGVLETVHVIRRREKGIGREEGQRQG